MFASRIERRQVCTYAQSSLTLCNPMDDSPPGSSVHGISQTRILEQVAICFSKGSSQPRDWTRVFCIGHGFYTTEPPGKREERDNILVSKLSSLTTKWECLQNTAILSSFFVTQSCWHFAIIRTVAHQAPLSMGFPRQEYWSGLPCPSPRDLHDPGIEHAAPMSPASGFFTC